MDNAALPTSLDLAMVQPKGGACGCGGGACAGGAGKGSAQGEEVEETGLLRRRAEALLEALSRARDEANEQLQTFNRTDAMRAVSGRTAIDAAIERTRDSLRSLDEALLARNDARPRVRGGGA
ncbi:MAG: hypothetical protein ACTS3F_10835 [Phycisphaerales bacterium]